MKRKKRSSLLLTEKPNPLSRCIDSASSLEIVRIMNREDKKIAGAVYRQRIPIAKAIDLGVEALTGGGRLFYVGAGTSGRLGVLDAAECPPTFGVPPSLVQGIIAGGKRALWRSAEGAEDDPLAGALALRQAGIGRRDVVCGISASGQTPFVKGALAEAKKCGAHRILIACTPHPKISPLAEVVIQPNPGPEVIAGSTRLKAGTATKMVLNMISTGIMIRTGRVYKNLMVDGKGSSRKLADRAERIIMDVLRCSRGKARALLREAGHRPKVAMIMGARGISAQEAQHALEEKKGFLGEVL
ncbi:MAG: N-acetylmuramic acid 6-phosphate etherase [Syntrophaceae bacterium]|nr:N-acetylmuramic acid 6-phosphate etherase [Syntrophaceae bacterium]